MFPNFGSCMRIGVLDLTASPAQSSPRMRRRIIDRFFAISGFPMR
jgi:hypothetical protein